LGRGILGRSLLSRPDLIRYLPIGGIDVPGGVDVAEMQDLATDDEKERQSEQGRRISTQDAADKVEVEQIRLFHRDKRADIEDEP